MQQNQEDLNKKFETLMKMMQCFAVNGNAQQQQQQPFPQHKGSKKVKMDGTAALEDCHSSSSM